MNFRSFYILISNNKIKSKNFVFILLFFLCILLVFSFILHKLDFEVTNNDIIKNYQIDKIDSKDFQSIDTIFVGDSSGGNSINNIYFNKLSGLNSVNLCLTGSWGIVGSLGIIKKSLSKNSNIKNIIVLQTIDIWHRDFAQESILELFEIDEQFELLDINSIIGYNFNIKEIWWHIKYLFDFKKLQKIDYHNDYLYQKKNKYSNSLLDIENKHILNKIYISENKIKELKMLDEYCGINSLNCILLNGPIHEEVVQNNLKIYSPLKDLNSYTNNIKYYDKIFEYQNNKIGDSLDHIDIKYKKESTVDYFNLIKKDLIY
jgi:hypothetical protein